MSKKFFFFTLILALVATSFVNVDLAAAGLSEAVFYLESQTPDAWITMALAVSGETELDLSYLTAVSGSQATDYEKTILALTAVGENPRDFGAEDLVAALKNDFYTENQIGNNTLLNDDFFGILALVSAGEDSTSTIIQDSKDFILDHQNGDGGWGYGVSAGSDTNDTAAAIMALTEVGLTAEDDEIEAALDYLKSQQNDDGGFPFIVGSDSDSGSDAWVISALYKVGEDPENWERDDHNPLTHLESLQLSDGSFRWQASDTVGSVTLTAYAVIALSEKFFPVNKITDTPSSADPEISYRLEGSAETICTGVIAVADPLTLIEEVAEICGFTYEITESSYGSYLSQINNEAAEGMNGWLYLVNYNLAEVAARDYELIAGDEVVWYYGEYDWPSLRLVLDKSQVNLNEEVVATVEFYDGVAWNVLAGAMVTAGDESYTTANNGQATIIPDQLGSYEVQAAKDDFVRSQAVALTVGSVSQKVNLVAVIKQPTVTPTEPEISFSVSGGQADFGTLEPGEEASIDLTLANTGQIGIYIEGVVSGDGLFTQNFYLNDEIWTDYETTLASSATEEIEASLVVPEDYTGEGQKQGDLFFWAVVAN